MKLIIGLGNPEKKYDNTYHNIGFSFIDKLAKKLDIDVKKNVDKSILGEKKISINNQLQKLVLVKPQTYMNLSGEAVLILKNKYKINTDDIYVICDDIDLPLGIFRYKDKGSAGTHNGLRNIINLLNDNTFKRIRVGIGRDDKMDLSDYVLSKISKDNNEVIESAISKSIDFLIDKLNIDI